MKLWHWDGWDELIFRSTTPRAYTPFMQCLEELNYQKVLRQLPVSRCKCATPEFPSATELIKF